MAVRKAVIPAAGLGTRCLPLTKAVPKELLPIYDRPALEVIAEEAAASGVEQLVLITGRGKSAIEDHFDSHPFLEAKLSGKPDLLASVRRQSKTIEAISVRQGAPLGLGHAVGCGERVVGDESFAVMLPDDLIFGAVPALKRLIDIHNETGKGVVLLMTVPKEQTQNYGIVSGETQPDGTILIDGLVEKPAPEDAPTNLAIVGRYVFPGSIFRYIRETQPGALGEIQLTDAMQTLAKHEGMIGVMIEGTRLDTGNPLGVLRAALHYAASRGPKEVEMIREFAKSLD
ncbi:MAG: UTP--glucose-1-phosphate uridylyltransferase [Myxococcota bacterium]|jgi:UTP--glucose-1-phosphate uridylyltransferase